MYDNNNVLNTIQCWPAGQKQNKYSISLPKKKRKKVIKNVFQAQQIKNLTTLLSIKACSPTWTCTKQQK